MPTSTSALPKTKNKWTNCWKCATVPSITHIIYDDPRGLRKYEEPGLISTAELKKLGAAWDKDHPGVGQHAAACAG